MTLATSLADDGAASLAIVAAGSAAAVLLAQARRRASPKAHWLATWVQALAGGLLATLGAVAAIMAWRAGLLWDQSPAAAAGAAAAFLAGAFACLVVERHLAATNPVALPDAPAVATLVRVPIAVLLLCGLGCLLLYAGVPLGAWAGRLAAVLCLLVSAELLLRALATMFVPFPPPAEARSVMVSTIAGALVIRRPRPVVATVRDWFGIDLSRSWALAFVRAAAAPVAIVLLLFAWGLSGVEALRVDQRAIYERFGRPVAVFGPGLHIHLPWPLGRLKPVELGVLHEVPIVFDAPATVKSAATTAAKAPPAAADDRLWDESHAGEASYLVASLSRGQQSFESIAIDLRVIYRIGLTDAAALSAAFAVDDPQRLVQSRTSRLLAHSFAGHTMESVLGADRVTFAQGIMTELQQELDDAHAGVQIMAVVVEAIHPPAGAAAAYHAVQLADIDAHTAAAEQQGYAARAAGTARRNAATALNDAAVAAHQAVIDADIDAIGFAADRTADARAPAPFRLERRLDRLSTGLAHRPFVVIDHRLVGPNQPTLDLRPPGGDMTVFPPRNPSR